MSPEEQAQLDKISSELAQMRKIVRRITGAGEDQTVGLFDEFPRTTVKLYVGEENKCCWYRMEEKNRVGVPQNCLIGTLKHVAGVNKTGGKHGPSKKIDFTIEADRIYVIRSGSNTHFTKGLVGALAKADDETLKGRIAVSVSHGGEAKVIFASLNNAETGQFIKGDRLNDHAEVVTAITEVCKRADIPFEKRVDNSNSDE